MSGEASCHGGHDPEMNGSGCQVSELDEWTVATAKGKIRAMLGAIDTHRALCYGASRERESQSLAACVCV